MATAAFKNATGIAMALQENLNARLRSRRRVFGKKYAPAQKVYYVCGPQGKALSVAGININAKVSMDDVCCAYQGNQWRCWAVEGASIKSGIYVFIVKVLGASERYELWHINDSTAECSLLQELDFKPGIKRALYNSTYKDIWVIEHSDIFSEMGAFKSFSNGFSDVSPAYVAYRGFSSGYGSTPTWNPTTNEIYEFYGSQYPISRLAGGGSRNGTRPANCWDLQIGSQGSCWDDTNHKYWACFRRDPSGTAMWSYQYLWDVMTTTDLDAWTSEVTFDDFFGDNTYMARSDHVELSWGGGKLLLWIKERATNKYILAQLNGAISRILYTGDDYQDGHGYSSVYASGSGRAWYFGGRYNASATSIYNNYYYVDGSTRVSVDLGDIWSGFDYVYFNSVVYVP